MPSRPDLNLACRGCGWIPDSDQPMGVFKAHVETEHGEDAEVDMDLVALCPRDGTLLDVRMTGVHADGSKTTSYDCPKCRRSYAVRWSPGEEPGHEA